MSNSMPRYIAEAIQSDCIFMVRLLRTFSLRQDSPLLNIAFIPISSRFVIESSNRIIEFEPNWRNHITQFANDLILPARHRTKLLISNSQDIHDIISLFTTLVKEDDGYFQNLHDGFLSKFKRFLQPDLGIFTSNSHIFSTTHTTKFTLGESVDLKTESFNIGHLIDKYYGEIINYLKLEKFMLEPYCSEGLIQSKMIDIKHASLYKRSVLGNLETGVSGLITVILANINFVHRILREVSFEPTDLLPFFKLRFLCVYHAQKSLEILQNILVPEGKLSKEVREIFKRVFTNLEAKWLKKQDKLREFLVHYGGKQMGEFSPELSYEESLEKFFKDKIFVEISVIIDLQLENISTLLKEGFDLQPNTFWYGAVS